MQINILSNTSRVETPFISVTIGGYSFGIYSRKSEPVIDSGGFSKRVYATYPNYMKSLSVVKLNGQINTYTITMEYNIRNGDDPNFLDKIFSKASKDRKIEISYGDLSSPTFVFRKESALMTDVKSQFDFASSRIIYTITCTSESLKLTAGTSFEAHKEEKPSNVLKALIRNNNYGLLEIFSGMRDWDLVEGEKLIASDDKKVSIEAKSNITVLDYIRYLVSCMTSETTTNSQSLTDGNKYILAVIDDTSGKFGGPYLKVEKVTSNVSEINSLDTYFIDIGFPSNNNVIGFSIDNNQAYTILYDYAKEIQQPEYNYRIDDQGRIEYIYAPYLARQSAFYQTTEVDKTWWTKVTQFPLTATLTIKGLLRPAVLMSYIKINTVFFGRKHISSGTYIITKQVDTVDASGYRTTLSLTRVAGEEL